MPPLYLVDAFTDRPFTGNPAAVVLLDGPVDVAWMLNVAAEMNLSETAFVTRAEPASADAWHLRWFTPAAEVELCGHATLAAAHVLWETARVDTASPIHFHTRFRGILTCTRQAGREPRAEATGEGPVRTGLIIMTFPADPPTDTPAPPELLAALSLGDVRPVNTARSRYDWIIELPDAAQVRGYEPDFSALAAIDCRGIALTACTGSTGSEPRVSLSGKRTGLPKHDVISRFFAPRLRVNEDPVTGSLHCALGPYWSARLGRQTLHCHQASSRGGDLIVTSRGDQVDLAGRAVTIAHATLI